MRGTTPDMKPDIEELLRAALSARAELVQPEDLAPPAPVAAVRPRWQTPWVLLATAAAVLLIMGVVFQGLGGRPPSDDFALRPDSGQVELPPDVGRDWEPDDLSSPARLDLDGDGRQEAVEFLAEPTRDYDGRTRLQTTLSSTDQEAYGVAELGTTIGTSALGSIDADRDGDQELVLYYDDLSAVGGGGYPLVFDLREGVLVEAVAEEPELLVRGEVPVAGSATDHYKMVRLHDYWLEDGQLFSSRSVGAYASGNMTLMRPESIVVDTWQWVLDEDDVLRPVEAGCRVAGPESLSDCAPGQVDAPPVVAPVATDTIGIGERVSFSTGYRFTARLEAFADPSLVVTGGDGRDVRHGLEIADPRVSTVQPTSVFSDGASLLVTSGSDPAYLQLLVQDGDRMRALQPVGEIPLENEGRTRTWLTRDGALVTVVAGEDGTWQAWQWATVSRTQMAALPAGTVCFADVDDPSTARAC